MAQRYYARTQKRAFLRRFIPNIPKKRLTLILLTCGGAFFLFSAATVLWWSRDLPNPQNINTRRIAESTKILDRTGEHILYEIGDIHRTVVPLDNISRYLRQATLAAEDDQFYEHHGLDFQGIVRGVIVKPLSGERAQGGSTITQQLIKNSILTPERTIRRKVKEAVLALELEQRFSKDQILEMYLNDIPYGSQAYGIEAASKTFFNKSAANLTLAEASLLAALPKAPTYYSPYGSHFEDLKRRQEHILNRMADLNMVTREQAEEAKNTELEFVAQHESIRAPHFVFYVKELLNEEYGERLIEQGGLTITTSLDVELQSIAEEAVSTHVATLNSLGASNAALTALHPQTGDVLAMVGSIDYFNQDIDGNVNVAIRHRSPGSSIKPFVYAAAFQRGYTPDTMLVDAETDFGQGYRPKNYDLSERGPVTMRTALANSLNIPAVKTLYLAGLNESTRLAQDMGMTSLADPQRYGLSLVLGGGEIRLVDEVSAYGVFANDGVRHPHRAVLKVTRGDDVIFDATGEEPRGEQVLDPQIVRLVTDILADNNARALTFGTRSPLQLGSRPVAAKTGTTQEFRDGWTMGFTPSLAVGVWVGNNDNTPMGDRSAGARTAAPIWNTFMRGALAGQPIEQFVKPEPIQNVPHGILRGELPEVKAKWDSDTNTVFSLECPVAIGQPRTFKELHSILFYVQRTNPLGPGPATAENDPQYDNWEQGIARWRDKQRDKAKDNPDEPIYTDSLPEPLCEVGDEEDLPKVRIKEPNTTIIKDSPVVVEAEVDSPSPLREVRFLLDGQEIARRGKDDPFVATFSFPDSFTGRKTILIQAITESNLVGRAHRTFIINPDENEPEATLHTPPDGTTLTPANFPYTVKVTATDESGIELIDVLFRKNDDDGNHRIGQTNKVVPVAPNRYEVTWNDSPGPGTYEVFVIARDKTGNFTETDPHRVTIDD